MKKPLRRKSTHADNLQSYKRTNHDLICNHLHDANLNTNK
jgi:hypothetical protein